MRLDLLQIEIIFTKTFDSSEISLCHYFKHLHVFPSVQQNGRDPKCCDPYQERAPRPVNAAWSNGDISGAEPYHGENKHW